MSDFSPSQHRNALLAASYDPMLEAITILAAHSKRPSAVLGFALLTALSHEELSAFLAGFAQAHAILSTPPDKRDPVTLEDGTQVWVKTCTILYHDEVQEAALVIEANGNDVPKVWFGTTRMSLVRPDHAQVVQVAKLLAPNLNWAASN